MVVKVYIIIYDKDIMSKQREPKRFGDYCSTCYWNRKDAEHVWWCHKAKEYDKNV